MIGIYVFFGFVCGFVDSCFVVVFCWMYECFVYLWMIVEFVKEVVLLCLMFFECFSCVVGVVLMEYLLMWCMVFVKDLFCCNEGCIVEIVVCVGYCFVSIFSVVFMWYVGCLFV